MFKTLFIILKTKKYAVIAILVTILMASISYYLTVINVYRKSLLIFAEMSGALFTLASLVLGFIIALLFGAYVALLIFRRDIIKKQAISNKAAGFSGAVTGLVAAGCPSCGAPLLGFIGAPLGLFSLPLKGLELKILSIAFLLLSIYLINKNIQKNLTCEIKK